MRTNKVGPLDWKPPDTAVADSSHTLGNVCGIDSDPTNALTYTPDYNYQTGVGTHGYETSIQYQVVGENLAEYRQGLISGQTIHLRPLVGQSVDVTGTGTETVTFYSGTTGETTGVNLAGEIVTIPTSLDELQWETIADETPQIVSVDVNKGEALIDFDDDSPYTIRCTPIGIGSPPGNTPDDPYLPDDGGDTGDGGDIGAGLGGESDWTPENNELVFSVANGRWNNVDVEEILFSEGQMVDQVQCTEGTNPAKAGSCTNVELLHLRLILYDDTKFYTVDFTLKDVNKDGDFTDGDVFCTGSGANERCIAEQKTVSVYDAGGTQVFHGNLQSSTADGILKQDDEASPQDILDSGIYQSTTGDDAALDALKLEDSTWITSGMSGRVVVEVAGDEGGG